MGIIRRGSQGRYCTAAGEY